MLLRQRSYSELKTSKEVTSLHCSPKSRFEAGNLSGNLSDKEAFTLTIKLITSKTV